MDIWMVYLEEWLVESLLGLVHVRADKVCVQLTGYQAPLKGQEFVKMNFITYLIHEAGHRSRSLLYIICNNR